ncbi:MAG: cofactor-independent phosphoglycerate mutase [Syntrophomonadaceae bacterium]|nr:cofactor-independent phosphoglycerate mutase [Syntrophomonadaceae bacterium]
MKYLLILADGMADYPIPELNMQTPLQYACTPNMDRLAKQSIIGRVATIPAGFPPGSDVANLSVMGYDPAIYYTGRSPLEAVSMGVELQASDLALRCNLVTLSPDTEYAQKTMVDYSAGEISTQESAQLMQQVQAELGDDSFTFYPGISYRHLLVWKNGKGKNIELTPPHDISGRNIADYLPEGNDAAVLRELMIKSSGILPQHPINLSRQENNHNPATSIWFWGEGSKPAMDSFQDRYGLKGSVVGAVDLVRGLGICAGLTPVAVSGATGSIVTNFAGKARAALDELKRGQDFVYLHIESPDEAGHQGSLEHKIWSIEQIDHDVLGMVLAEMEQFSELRVMLLPDHPTPIAIKTHSSEPVPFMIFDKNNPVGNGLESYDESSSNQGSFVAKGHELMALFIKG